MKPSQLQENIIIILTLLPFLYLGIVYWDLPEMVPGHWDASGNITRYDHKESMWAMLGLLCGLTYIIMKFIPKMDPKNQIKKMGKTYFFIRLGISLFTSITAIGIVFMTQYPDHALASNPSWVFILIGILYVVLGNYMPAMKPNYFVGVRTPWTLENETVWRKTHRISAYVFIIAGLSIFISAIVCSSQTTFIVTIGTSIAAAIIAMAYSYVIYNKIKNS